MRVLHPETVQFIADMEMSLCAHDDATIPAALVRDWIGELIHRLGPLPAPTSPDKLRRELGTQIDLWMEQEGTERERALALRAQMSGTPTCTSKPVSYQDAFLDAASREAAATSNTLLRVREIVQGLIRRPR